MSEIKDRLASITLTARDNNVLLENLIIKIKEEIKRIKDKHASEITVLNLRVQTAEEQLVAAQQALVTAQGQQGAELVAAQEALVVSQTTLQKALDDLAAERAKLEGVDGLADQLESIIGNTSILINNANEDKEIFASPVTLGGKSTKRKRHNKKHSKGKSRKIRNKKHKSK